MKAFWSIALIAATLALTSCGGGEEATASPEETPAATTEGQPAQPQLNAPQQQQPAGAWRTFADADFQIRYPGEWQLNANSQFGAAFELYAPSNQQDGFAENINLIKQGLNGQTIALQDYAAISMQQIQKVVDNSNVLASGIYNNGANDYFEIVYTGGQGQLLLKWRQHFYVQDTTAYVLTYSAQQNSFDQHNTQATAIMSSFRLQ